MFFSVFFYIWCGLAFSADEKRDFENFSVDGNYYLGLRALQNNNFHERRSEFLSATALISPRIKRGRDLVALQLRPALTHTSGASFNESQAYVDELYWERAFSPRMFAFAGRRKIVNGVAIGRNPSNFFNLGKTQDRTLSDEDRRAETQGDDMVGWSYFGQSYSVQSVVATRAGEGAPIRAMLQANGNLDSLSADFTLIAYYAERPALGLNLSTVVGEKVTAYAEAALRKGRDRQRPVLSAGAVLIGASDDDNRWIADVVLGGQYTTGTGITLTAEYWRNNNGFSESEYAGIVNSLLSGQGNARLAGRMLASVGFRKNSAFFRVGDISMLDSLKGELTWIRNLDDSSSLARCALVWDIGKQDSLRLGVDVFSGSRVSEFGSSRTDRRVFINYKRHL